MRFLILSLAIACGAKHHAESSIDQCRLLDSPDLHVRSGAATKLADLVPVLEGGTEQQMEAAGRYCERTYGLRPAWLR
jgi:hypothetical protein